MDDFVIHFSLLFSPSSSEAKDELGKLRLALTQCGCFQAINHGMTSKFLDKVREVTNSFFALPLEEKWPEKPVAFREIIHEYTLKLRAIFDLMKAMARSLNLEENCFLKEHGDMVTMFARFNFYPPCPTPESVLGVKPHADGVTFTMLLQDKKVEGLQVLKDDQWFKVPIVPDALFINVGDMLEIMSSGILKNPVHRMVTNSKKGKISYRVLLLGLS